MHILVKLLYNLFTTGT